MRNMRCRTEVWWTVRIFKLSGIVGKRKVVEKKSRILILRSLSSAMSRDKKILELYMALSG